MANLGKSLIFHLKYQPEMTRYYRNEEKPDGLESLEETLAMVRTVGDASKQQAANFLEECEAEMRKHFEMIAKYHRITNRGILEKKWSLSSGVWQKPKFRPKPGTWKLKVGVDLVDSAGGEIVPWIWAPGRAAAEEQLCFFLKDRVKARSQDFKWDPGTVGLARIPILAEGIDGFDLNKEPLIRQVAEAFETISLLDLRVLLP